MDDQEHSEKISELLEKWHDGDAEAYDAIFELLFKDFQEIAHFQMNKERIGHTLQTGDLVNKLYIKMRDAKQKPWRERTHLKRSASRMMKQILIDHARSWMRRSDGKAGVPIEALGGEAGDFKGNDSDLFKLLSIKNAIEKLEDIDPKMAKVAYLKIVHGYTMEEIGKHLETATTNVKREWSMVKKIIGPILPK